MQLESVKVTLVTWNGKRVTGPHGWIRMRNAKNLVGMLEDLNLCHNRESRGDAETI